MKTSYKLLMLAIIIIFGTTAAYDFAVQKQYLKHDYTNPWRDYNTMQFKDFDTIEVVASNRINTEIIRSDTFDVKLHMWVRDAKITQKGKRLIVNFDTQKDPYQHGYTKRALIIKCPVLKEVETDAKFLLNGKPVLSRAAQQDRLKGGQVLIKGFNQNEFSLVMNNASTVFLKDNNFKFLKANIGSQDSSRSSIELDNSNKILSADMDLQNRSVMTLDNIHIKNFKYKLSDSAQVNLSGISLRLLSKKN
ncbi:MAG: hypothetical protein WKF68_10835 [Daejeonella sp.]